MAELDLLTKTLNVPPILILDDVLAELDITRQNLLLNSVGKDSQCFISATHLEKFNKSFYQLDTDQVISILELRLQKLTAFGISEIETEISKLAKLIVDLNKILNSKKIKPGVYNVGYGKPKKVRDIISMIHSIIKRGKPDFGKIKMRKDEIPVLYPDIKKVVKTINSFAQV